jgi:heme oxygenase
MSRFAGFLSMLPASQTPTQDPLAALRAATASRHEALDSSLAIGAENASLADYAAHLRLLHAWLAPMATWLAGFDDGPASACAARLALIDADLDEAGVGRDQPCATAPWSATASAAYRWGVCYVIEGSQLGGAVLYARLRERLAPHALRYLKGEEGGPGAGWRVFMQALRAHVRGETAIEEACAGACAAFDAMLALRDAHAGPRAPDCPET